MAHHDHGSRHYEREAETTRRRLSHSLDELNERLTPGQLFDEVLAYTKGGGYTFMRAFSAAARDNPIPSLLIGTGCMLFLSEKMGLNPLRRGESPVAEDAMAGPPMRRSSGRTSSSALSGVSNVGRTVAGAAASGVGAMADAAVSSAGAVADAAASGAGAVAESVRSGVRGAASFTAAQGSAAADAVKRGTAAVADTMSAASRQVTEKAHDWRDQASSAADQVMQGAQSVAGTVQDYSSAIGQQMSDTAEMARRQAGRMAAQTADTAKSFVNEQPLLCAAIGVALGAALAAMLPSTRAENELMGEASDSVKKALGDAAAEQLETAKSAAGKVAQQAMDTAAREGLTASAAVEAVRTLGDKVTRVVNETASTGAAEMKEMAGTAKADVKEMAGAKAPSAQAPSTSSSATPTFPKAMPTPRPLPGGMPERERSPGDYRK
jgi:ElaB/YqjD/DUF883 family membrane-anchored ribosome-binding protein